MPVPQFTEKYDAPSVVTPEGAAEDVPDAMILCYQSSLFEHVVEEHATERIDGLHGMMDGHVLADTGGQVGVAGNFGIGAPVTALMMEDLVAAGAETFLSAGYAGCLQQDVTMDDVVLVDRAIRDEGTSHHYLEPATDVQASESLLAHLRTELGDRDVTVYEGATWTTDAAYRETVPEIERYAADGVLTVEMEAAATFAVAEYRGVEAASVLVVSDYLGSEEWDPRFHLTDEHLERLFVLARDALSRY